MDVNEGHRPNLRAVLPSDGAIRIDAIGDLWVEGLRADNLAARFGTPLYVASEAQIRENYRRLHRAFAERYPSFAILYANKANNNLAVRRILTDEGAGGDCFGPGELALALRAGTAPSLLVLNGTNKGIKELRQCIELGVTINVDHPDELEIVARLADLVGERARVNLRVLPFTYADLSALDPDDVTIASDRSHDKWGMDPPTTLAAARRALALPQVDLRGLHIHVSRIRPTADPFGLAAALILQCIDELRRLLGWTPRVLDLGGGFAHQRDPESGARPGSHEVATPEVYAHTITSVLLAGFQSRQIDPPTLWIEPGRHLIGNTTILLTRVGIIKRLPTATITWVNVDASTNHLMRVPLQGYWHEIVPVVNARRRASMVANVVGPNCTLDLLAADRSMPRVSQEEILAVLDVGAYAESYVTRFNMIPRPATVLVSGEQADIIRRRETTEELFEGQEVPARLLG